MLPRSFVSLIPYMGLIKLMGSTQLNPHINHDAENDPVNVALPFLHRMTFENLWWVVSCSFPRELFSGMGRWKTSLSWHPPKARILRTREARKDWIFPIKGEPTRFFLNFVFVFVFCRLVSLSLILPPLAVSRSVPLAVSSPIDR